MLPEALSRTAAEAGVAVVETAGTGHWTLFGEQVACWLARGGQAERADLARLAETEAALRLATDSSSRAVAVRHAMVWQGRFTAVLERLSADGRHPAAAHLQRLVRDHPTGAAPAASAPGVIAGENVQVATAPPLNSRRRGTSGGWQPRNLARSRSRGAIHAQSLPGLTHLALAAWSALSEAEMPEHSAVVDTGTGRAVSPAAVHRPPGG